MNDIPKDDRRQSADRRNKVSRRRHAESRRLYIELCHSVLRVALVVDDDTGSLPKLRMRTMQWRYEADDLMCDEGRAELAAALRTLVTEERLTGCSVALAISSTLCVNRATSGATTKVEQEIADLKERSQLYLSLGPGPKTSAVGRKQIDARHEHALVTVTNERTLELLVDAVESAGLSIDAIESALVALARLQGHLDHEDDSAVILAQLDEQCFELGVSRQGQLLLEYRPSSESTLAQLGQIVDHHHERLIRFCARQYGVGNMGIDRMWLVGKPVEIASTVAQTQTKLKTGVMPLDRLAEHWSLDPEETITAEMGAALGLALRGRSDEKGVSPNLMDEILARAKKPIRPFLIRAAAPIAATLLLAASLWALNLEQRAELSALREKVEEVAPAALRGQALVKQITDAGNEIEHLADLVEKTPSRPTAPLIVNLGQCLPGDVWLKSVRLLGRDKLGLSGASYTESGVYDFVRHLNESPNFQEVALRGTGIEQTSSGPATSFEIDLERVPAVPALEGEKK